MATQIGAMILRSVVFVTAIALVLGAATLNSGTQERTSSPGRTIERQDDHEPASLHDMPRMPFGQP